MNPEKLRILYLAHVFPPELSGAATRIYELSRYWALDGHDVTVATGFPTHPHGIVPEKYKGYWVYEENIDGIRVVRAKKYATANKGFYRRILNYLTSAFSGFMTQFNAFNRYDVIIATSPPLFMGISGFLLRRRLSVPYIFEARDIWPKQAIDLGVLKNPVLIKMAKFLEKLFYKDSDCIVTVTEGFRQIIASNDISMEKIYVIRNGADIDLYNIPRDKEVLVPLGINNKFVISYIGTFGLSQGLSVIIECANLLREVDDIHFLLIGDGAEWSYINNIIIKNNLTKKVTILKTIPKENVPKYYAASDISLIPLKRNDEFLNTIPSKAYEIMAAGLPIILAVDGEARELFVDQAKAAIFCEPENSVMMASIIKEMYHSPSLRASLGINGKKWVLENCSRQQQAREYIKLINNLLHCKCNVK